MRVNPRVHLVASLGGHLEQLQAAVESVSASRTWLTSEGVKADFLRRRGERVLILPRLDRNTLRPRGVLAGVQLALRERPAIVITTGAGLAIPFTLVSRVMGARVIFIETQARVRRPSATGKILAKFAEQILVQWPDLKAAYPRAIVCQPFIKSTAGRDGAGSSGKGTFVTVGSHDQPFDRMLDLVRIADEAGILPHPLTIQRGVSRLDLPGVVNDFMAPEEFERAVAGAQLVISHGGSGAIATALRFGRRPIVVSRSAELGEHVDNHQDELVGRLEEEGYLVRASHEITRGQVQVGQIPSTVSSMDVEHAPRVPDVISEILAARFAIS